MAGHCDAISFAVLQFLFLFYCLITFIVNPQNSWHNAQIKITLLQEWWSVKLLLFWHFGRLDFNYLSKVVNSAQWKPYPHDRCRCQNATKGSLPLIRGVTMKLNPDYNSILNSIDSVILFSNVLFKINV